MRYLFIWDILSNFTSVWRQMVLLLLTLHCNCVFLIVSDETKFSKEAKKKRVSSRGPRDTFFRELSGTDISVYDRIPDDVLDEKGAYRGFSMLCLIEQKWRSERVLLPNRLARKIVLQKMLILNENEQNFIQKTLNSRKFFSRKMDLVGHSRKLIPKILRFFLLAKVSPRESFSP